MHLGNYMLLKSHAMRQVPLERDINIAINGPFLVEVANQEWAIYGNVYIMLLRHLPHYMNFSAVDISSISDPGGSLACGRPLPVPPPHHDWRPPTTQTGDIQPRLGQGTFTEMG